MNKYTTTTRCMIQVECSFVIFVEPSLLHSIIHVDEVNSAQPLLSGQPSYTNILVESKSLLSL